MTAVTGPTLQTRRLRLHPLAPADLDAVHALWTAPEIREYLWDGETIDRERALEPLRASATDFGERGYGLWGLRQPPAAELAGFCGLRRSGMTPEPELLFGLRGIHWGQGLAHEAACAVLEHAFGGLRLPEVGAAADVPNRRSVRLLERLGARRLREAEVNGRPTLFYRLTATEWNAREGRPRRPEA